MDGWMDVCMCVSFYSKFTSYSNNVKGAKTTCSSFSFFSFFL